MRVTYAPASENKLKVDLGKVGAYSRGLELLYHCAELGAVRKAGLDAGKENTTLKSELQQLQEFTRSVLFLSS